MNENLKRRQFVKKSTLAGTAAALSPLAAPFLHAQGNGTADKQLKIGIVGLGGRGTGAVGNALAADRNTILWAAGDAIADRSKAFKARIKKWGARADTDGGKREFTGLDAYQKVIDSGVDIVLLCAAPGFRPVHFAYAVNAGKHVFIEKPIAIDVPGLKSVIDSATKAKANNQSVLTGLVWRYSTHLMEAHKRIQGGEIGDVLSVSSAYSGGNRPNRMPDPKFKPPTMTDMEWAIRYWQNYLELSGDCIMEFMIHGLDKMSWYMGDHIPAKCYANGANITPIKGSNNWDQFSINYEYPDGRCADFIGRQVPGTFTPSGDNITGSKGRAIVDRKSAKLIVDGKTIWEQQGGLGYVEEHKILFKHIREGNVYNDILDQMANSHALAIMGRTAAYTGQLITKEKLLSSQEVLFNPENLTLDSPFTSRPTAHPGKTKFA